MGNACCNYKDKDSNGLNFNGQKPMKRDDPKLKEFEDAAS
jgi:hypothetical protein